MEWFVHPVAADQEAASLFDESIAADDPRIAHLLPPTRTQWVGRDKPGAGGEIIKKNARVVVDDQKRYGRLDPNPSLDEVTCVNPVAMKNVSLFIATRFITK